MNSTRGSGADSRLSLRFLPQPGRAVRGNSSIGETELIFGVLALRAAWVDGRGFVDGAEVAALEEAQSDQIGEAQDRDLDAMAAGGEAQQRVGDHRGKDLEADRVVVVAEEAADVEMLFDPAETAALRCRRAMALATLRLIDIWATRQLIVCVRRLD